MAPRGNNPTPKADYQVRHHRSTRWDGVRPWEGTEPWAQATPGPSVKTPRSWEKPDTQASHATWERFHTRPDPGNAHHQVQSCGVGQGQGRAAPVAASSGLGGVLTFTGPQPTLPTA